MKIQNYLLTLTVFGAYSTAGAVSNPSADRKNTKSVKNAGRLTCGGTLNTTTGVIVHKPLGNTTVNERCVWLIKPPSAQNITIKSHLAFQPTSNETGLHLTAFSYDPSTSNHTRFQTYLDEDDCTFTDVQLIMITFYTGSKATTKLGFILEYASSSSGSDGSVSGNVVEVHNANNGSKFIRYPAWGEYGNRELTPIIFKPVNNKYDPSKLVNYALIRTGLQGDRCNDRVWLFAFDARISSPLKWMPSTALCSGDSYKNAAFYTGKDLVLLLFESDQYWSGTGFHVTVTANEIPCRISV